MKNFQKGHPCNDDFMDSDHNNRTKHQADRFFYLRLWKPAPTIDDSLSSTDRTDLPFRAVFDITKVLIGNELQKTNHL